VTRQIHKYGGVSLVKSIDVGSLPFTGDSKLFVEGASHYLHNSHDAQAEHFERMIVKGLLDKLDAGIDVPNYPQFRDMSEMFLSAIDGLERIDGGYLEVDTLAVRDNQAVIPEVLAIKKSSRLISEEKGGEFELKVCITGPYTLSAYFPYKRAETFQNLGEVISRIVENSIFDDGHGRVSVVSVDEPLFGLQDDPLLDFGAEGRESLRRAWESIFCKVKSRNAQTMMHLHRTVDGLFWDVESLEVIDSHVDDSLIQTEKTRGKLESTDKFLKGSIAYSSFDRLITEQVLASSRGKLDEVALNEKVAEAWTRINRGETSASVFLENMEAMKKRLAKLVERFGKERVPFAGPECGLKGFPTYESALEYLGRVSNAINTFNLHVA